MDVANALKFLRLDLRLTQPEFAQKIGVTTAAICGWEKGRSNPSVDTVITICKNFNVSADIVLGLDEETPREANTRVRMTNDEKDILQKYRSLDSFGRESVSLILNHEIYRVDAKKENTDDNIIEFDKSIGERYIPKFLTPAAAGYSSTIDDAEFEMLLVDKTVPHGADYAVVIQGESMSPYIKDGEVVYVKKTEEVSVGEVGIFSVNGSMYCKMFYITGSGDIWLVSTNEKMKGSNVHIQAGSNDSFKCLGKILLREKPKLPNYFMQEMIP